MIHFGVFVHVQTKLVEKGYAFLWEPDREPSTIPKFMRHAYTMHPEPKDVSA